MRYNQIQWLHHNDNTDVRDDNAPLTSSTAGKSLAIGTKTLLKFPGVRAKKGGKCPTPGLV